MYRGKTFELEMLLNESVLAFHSLNNKLSLCEVHFIGAFTLKMLPKWMRVDCSTTPRIGFTLSNSYAAGLHG